VISLHLLIFGDLLLFDIFKPKIFVTNNLWKVLEPIISYGFQKAFVMFLALPIFRHLGFFDQVLKALFKLFRLLADS
jgi:hypothetical protein